MRRNKQGRYGAAGARWSALALASVVTLGLAGCGGGGSGSATSAVAGQAPAAASASGSAPNVPGAPASAAADAGRADALAVAGASQAEAARLLAQTTFGPTSAAISDVMARGSVAWVDSQLAMPAQAVHRTRWLNIDRQVKHSDRNATAGSSEVTSSIYQQALFAPDQLRQRVAYALSQIFVISTMSLGNDQAQTAADYYDMLGRDALGNFRTLLQDVALHPAMGIYLSHQKSRPADATTGRQPDQNFAREVMQLFTIGLSQLNLDGTPKLQSGAPIETYFAGDIEGLAAVFTGFSWGGADTNSLRFYGVDAAYQDPNRLAMPMQGYAQYHAKYEKKFLGTTVAAQATADPNLSVKLALDTLAAHPNVGPFISRQLIQRLVVSNPTPAYVARVAAVFNDNGRGVRGDLKSVVRAILLDDEARNPARAAQADYGKVREPVLRLTAYLRAFGARSDSGEVLMLPTDSADKGLNQTPLRSPSVFNFYRPGYVPSGSEAAAAGMTLPEMQITDEGSVAGYANYMMSAVDRGVGQKGRSGLAARPDLQVAYSAELAVAADAPALVSLVASKLLPGAPSSALQSQIVTAVNATVIPAARPGKEPQIEKAKRNRVLTAVLLTTVSPEFIVQK